MKHFTLLLSLLFAISISSYAQPTNLPSSINIIDAQSGQLVPATGDAATAFKNSFIALVINTKQARFQSAMHVGIGKRSFVINQADPAANGNAYQLTLQRATPITGDVIVMYTFQYSVDQNKLYVADPNTGDFSEVAIDQNNQENLTNCQTFGIFNEPQGAPLAAAPDNSQPAAGPAADTTAAVDVNVTATNPPPALPDPVQPECPTEGFLWQPGFWSFNLASGYYWVPGAWVAPPQSGVLWTPPYWGFVGGVYAFNAGYWGPTVGFYGGINYGFGYGGADFVGGRWDGGYFRYNTAVMRVNVAVIHNTYVDNRVVFHGVRNSAAFNGGHGGIVARPNAREMAAMHENHIAATHEQIRNQQLARNDRTNFASNNGGHPANVANAHVPNRPAASAAARPGTGARPGTPGAARPGTPGARTPARTGPPPSLKSGAAGFKGLPKGKAPSAPSKKKN